VIQQFWNFLKNNNPILFYWGLFFVCRALLSNPTTFIKQAQRDWHRIKTVKKIRSGQKKESLKRVHFYVHQYWDSYEAAAGINFDIRNIEDFLHHITALKDLLSEAYSFPVSKALEKKIGFLLEFKNRFPESQFIYVLLAEYYYLQGNSVKSDNLKSRSCWEFDRNSAISFIRSERSIDFFGPIYHFIHLHWQSYPPAAIGNFKLFAVNDISRHVSAVEDLLMSGFSNTSIYPTEKQTKFLRELIEVYPDDRFYLVALAERYRQQKKYTESILLMESSLSIDSRCLISQYILTEAIKEKQNKNRGNTEQTGTKIPENFKPLISNLANKFCDRPFRQVIINPTGDVHTCCSLFLPISIGNIYQQSWDAIWNSDSARKIRQSILDGDYTYCNRLHCPSITQELLVERDLVTDSLLQPIIQAKKTRLDSPVETADIGHDDSCNLACPQCRTDLKFAKGERLHLLDEATSSVILPMMNQVESIIITNTGEPFASKQYLKILKSIDPDKQTLLKHITIVTNGVLFSSKIWSRLSNIHHLKIKIAVSVDAATEVTYSSIRVRGNWKKLMNNMLFISGLRKSGKIDEFEMRFCVQACNFREMKAFVGLCDNLGADIIVFNKLSNPGIFSADEYRSRMVFSPEHFEYKELLKILRDPDFEDRRLFFSDFIEVVDEAKKS
jgi:MoaA/NifB/PqqE/SkfB family radical SAM enzyme